MKANPFRPNSPVNPGMFVGRLQEIERLEQALVQARAQEPAHFMITGERGIGKTSLLLYLKYLAKGDISFNSANFRYMVLDLDVDDDAVGRRARLDALHRRALLRVEDEPDALGVRVREQHRVGEAAGPAAASPISACINTTGTCMALWISEPTRVEWQAVITTSDRCRWRRSMLSSSCASIGPSLSANTLMSP